MTRRGPIFAVVIALGAVACDDTPPADPPVCQLPPAAAARSSSTQPAQCGSTLDLVPVNSYQGDLSIVQAREDAVALLGGTCTGTLIAAAAGPVVLTAGHCGALGDEVVVSFNFEDAPDGDPLITTGTIFEQSADPDYALLRLAALPAVTPTPLGTLPSDRLAIIQHPRGMRKQVAEGEFLDSCDRQIYYADLDTLVGSSGAGVLSRDGYLIGVHTDGDCTTAGRGSNRGWTAASVVDASPYLVPADLSDR